MNKNRMSFLVSAFVFLAVLTVALWAADAWKVKKYTEWSDSEALQVLHSSPWATTVPVVTGINPLLPGESNTGPGGARPSGQVDEDTTRTTDYEVAWYSSVPVREAQARLALLKNLSTEEQIKRFLEPVTELCLISVSGRFPKTFLAANKEDLLKKTYLQVRGKDKVYATNVVPPSSPQGRMAIFQFPRALNGVPILSEEDKDVEFVADLEGYKIRAHFAPKKMVFDGKFTY